MLSPITEDDVAALQALYEATPGYFQRVEGHPPGPGAALHTLTTLPPDTSADAKYGFGWLGDGDNLLAFADVIRGYPSTEMAYIGLFMVRGTRQHEGLGSRFHAALLDEVNHWAEVDRIQLAIVQTNRDAAEPFWVAMGYEPTGVIKPYTSDKVSTTCALWQRPAHPAEPSRNSRITG